MISLYESIFTVADPSSAKKVADVVRDEVIKKDILSKVIRGDAIDSYKKFGHEKNITISDDGILSIPQLNRVKNEEIVLWLNNQGKEILDRNGITGINFIPDRSGDPESFSGLYLHVPKNIDLKTDHGPFEIINTGCMFTNYGIESVSDNSSTINDFGCIKNLKFSSSVDINSMEVDDHIFDSCDLGRCKYIYFRTTWRNMHPTALLKNSKLSTSEIRIEIDRIDDVKILQEWKDFLFDGSDLKKDLLKLLGFNNIKLNRFAIRIGYNILADNDYGTIYIMTSNQVPPPSPAYDKIGGYNVQGVTRKVYVYATKKYTEYDD